MLEFLEKPGVVIVLLVALVVFGAKRLPDSARSLGRSLRIFKAETRGLREDEHTVPPTPLPPAPVQQVQQVQQVQPPQQPQPVQAEPPPAGPPQP